MYAFFILPIFIAAYLFFCIRRVAFGKRGSVLALVILLSIFLCFFLRTNRIFAYGQTALIIWVTQATILYLLADAAWGLTLAISKIRGKLPSVELRKKWRTNISRATLAVSILIAAIFIGYGIPHNQNYTLREIEIALPKNAKPFTAYYFSDLHIDPIFQKSKLERMIFEVDSIKPDFILFGGDFADITDSAMDSLGYNKIFSTFNSKAKSFGVSGNHEAYMQAAGSSTETWMQKNGMIVLIDSTICNETLCITGRMDFHVARQNKTERKPLAKLAPGAICKDTACQEIPWIVLDHQPKGMKGDDASYNGKKPTIVLSGHTHDGQFFPITAFIGIVWKLAYGIGEIDGFKWLVSSGIHSWGPPVRIGSSAEAWILKFK